MGTIVGIDVGISTTKIVGMRAGEVISPMQVRASDPVTSLYGAFGGFLRRNGLALSGIEGVVLTGVGAGYIDSAIYGLPTFKVEEFLANGVGARHQSGRDSIIVVSMGTGTSLVKCEGGEIRHLCGIGIGGGTLVGLARLLLNTDDVGTIIELARDGDLSRINLLIGDICQHPLPGLPMDAVATLFGNARADATREDIARGLMWMVLQTVGQSAVLASLGSDIREYVMIGNLTLFPLCREVFDELEGLYGVRLIIPGHSEYCTAIGAALCHFEPGDRKSVVA